MNFNENQSIYLQITAFVKEQILLDKWKKEEKIPSVRELAFMLQVNPNTVMHAYELLQQEGVIYNRRGLGNYVSADAGEKIFAERKNRFLQSEIPSIFRTMQALGIEFNELKRLYDSFNEENRTK